MTPASIIAHAYAYHQSREARWHSDLTQTELETFWLAVFRLRDGANVVEVEREFSRPDRGVTLPPRKFGRVDRSVKTLSPMEADRLKRDFWGDQTASGTPLEWILP